MDLQTKCNKFLNADVSPWMKQLSGHEVVKSGTCM